MRTAKAAVTRIVQQLEERGIARQTPADRLIGFSDCGSVAPPATGESRLLDGTHVVVSGSGAASGDAIQRTISIEGHDVAVDAEGLVAVRLNKEGRVETLAAGGLKSLNAGDLKIELTERVDLRSGAMARGGFTVCCRTVRVRFLQHWRD